MREVPRPSGVLPTLWLVMKLGVVKGVVSVPQLYYGVAAAPQKAANTDKRATPAVLRAAEATLRSEPGGPPTSAPQEWESPALFPGLRWPGGCRSAMTPAPPSPQGSEGRMGRGPALRPGEPASTQAAGGKSGSWATLSQAEQSRDGPRWLISWLISRGDERQAAGPRCFPRVGIRMKIRPPENAPLSRWWLCPLFLTQPTGASKSLRPLMGVRGKAWLGSSPVPSSCPRSSRLSTGVCSQGSGRSLSEPSGT